jgi:ATP-binding cassette, subfamily B, multidrug efflux pump
MSKVSGKVFDSSLLLRIYRYSLPYRRIFITGVVLTLLLALLAPLRPFITQYSLDHFIISDDRESLLFATIAMVAVLLIQSVLQYYHSWFTSLLGQEVIRDLRSALFRKMVSFRLRFFDRTPVGTTVTRSVSDMETIADIFSEGIIIIIGDLLQLAVIIGVMFWMDWRLALISLSTIPLLFIATRIFQKKIKETFGDVRTQVAALNSFVQEHLTGMRIVQIFHREKQEYRKFETINRRHRDANIRSVWYYSVFFPVVEILSAVSIGLIVWWGAGGVIREEVTFGNLVAFIMYINMLFRPIRELADKFNTLQMGMVSSERIFKVLDEDEVTPPGGNHSPERVKGEIEFRNVWFAYDFRDGKNPDSNWILRDVSFKVKPGESVAFVGATGAGKTTIISLLNRFYEISKGSILIDGIDIREFSLDSLRSQVGVVLQDVFLFSDTVMNNITMRNMDITEESVRVASVAVGADAFIRQLPGAYEFHVQERGAVLSMGQRQMISFIRAYVYNPAILVLDEATSSVDSETEEAITRATHALTNKRTSIIIAHRLATIQNADRIIVMDHGKVMEQGNHRELMERNGLYRELFEIQFRNLYTRSV